jgi:outer membrane murein-binding lipoprotein Lpp
MEKPMEARVARLEADVAHLRSDVGDIKTDVRTLRDKMDTMTERFDAKFDALRSEIAATNIALKDGLAATDDRMADAKVWALVLGGTLVAGTFGTMARAFGWL